MTSHNYSFENLEVYQLTRKLVKDIYILTARFPKDERFELTSQIRRAVVSVISNLAEGSGRCAVKEKIHFIEIAFGSAMEVYCQLQVAVDLDYLSPEDFDNIKPDFHVLTKKLNNLKQSFSTKI